MVGLLPVGSKCQILFFFFLISFPAFEHSCNVVGQSIRQLVSEPFSKDFRETS